MKKSQIEMMFSNRPEILRLDLTSISEADRKLAENYQCVICQMITSELMVCPKCEKNTCFECYKNYKKCPIKCGCSMEKLSRKAVQMLKDMQAKCKNFKFGCINEITLEKYLEHSKTCEFEMLSCQEKDCDFKCIRRDFPTQHSQCPHKLLNCQFCEINVKRTNLNFHERLCPMRFLPCPVDKLCHEKIRAIDLEQHTEVCPYKMVTCHDCGALMKRMEKKTHSCIYHLKNELITVCSSVTYTRENMNRFEVENITLSKKNAENEKNIKELNLKMMNYEKERKEREIRENGLVLKIKASEEEKNFLSKKLEANEKSISQLILTMQNWEKRAAKPEFFEEMKENQLKNELITLSKKNAENEKNIKELNLKMNNYENERKEREDRDNVLVVKIEEEMANGILIEKKEKPVMKESNLLKKKIMKIKKR